VNARKRKLYTSTQDTRLPYSVNGATSKKPRSSTEPEEQKIVTDPSCNLTPTEYLHRGEAQGTQFQSICNVVINTRVSLRQLCSYIVGFTVMSRTPLQLRNYTLNLDNGPPPNRLQNTTLRIGSESFAERKVVFLNIRNRFSYLLYATVYFLSHTAKFYCCRFPNSVITV
jgi:hypothetical protein